MGYASGEGKKESLIAGLVEIRGRILATAASLSPAQAKEIFLGVWSVEDLLAHLIGWDFTNLEAVKSILQGELPGFYAFHDKDWRSYNAQLVAKYKVEDFGELLAAVATAQRELVDFLTAIPAGEFEKERGIRFRGYKVTIARLLRAELEDETVHDGQIAAFAEKVARRSLSHD